MSLHVTAAALVKSCLTLPVFVSEVSSVMAGKLGLPMSDTYT